MGQVVETKRRPHVWIPGQLPFYVSDESKLKIICPMRYRLYADKVEHYVPYRTEEVEFVPADPNASSPAPPAEVPGAAARCGALDLEALCLPCGAGELEDLVMVADLPAVMTPEEIKEDEFIPLRTKSQREATPLVETAIALHAGCPERSEPTRPMPA